MTTIPVYSPDIGAAEVENAVDCIKRGMLSGTIGGDYNGEFETLVSKQCGASHGITTTSGTTALALAVACIGVGEGDEIIVPASTNIATALAVTYTGATPVFIDSESDTWCMDCELLPSLVTPRTRAIMPVHLYGHPADMDAIMDVADRHNLVVIEDNAEAQGANYKGRATGGIGHIGCLSFYINKVLTTGEGGMLVTNDEEIAARARLLKNLAYSERDRC